MTDKCFMPKDKCIVKFSFFQESEGEAADGGMFNLLIVMFIYRVHYLANKSSKRGLCKKNSHKHIQ